jgi:GNAT superfamily N-acetyltransferase
MKLLKWVRFTWDLTKLPSQDVRLPQHYEIAATTAEDEKLLRKVFSSSFLLDPSWNSAIGEAMQIIQSRLDAALASDQFTCLALRHGPRIIGAVLLGLDENAEDQLSLGPSILPEYRNRGFGTRLLESSLIWLREAGLTNASGMALDYAPVAKFLYPKFDGMIVRAETPELLAV